MSALLPRFATRLSARPDPSFFHHRGPGDEAARPAAIARLVLLLAAVFLLAACDNGGHKGPSENPGSSPVAGNAGGSAGRPFTPPATVPPTPKPSAPSSDTVQ
ncbi:MAG TPA: hypothetical protein VH916_00795, partial [Dehalococcoidia bacterium]